MVINNASSDSNKVPWENYRSNTGRLDRGPSKTREGFTNETAGVLTVDQEEIGTSVLRKLSQDNVDVSMLLVMWPDWRQRLSFHGPILVQAGIAGFTSLQIGKYFGHAFGFTVQNIMTMKYGNPVFSYLLNLAASVNFVSIPLFMAGWTPASDDDRPCPVCLEARQITTNLATGIFMPALFSPIICMSYGYETGSGKGLPTFKEFFQLKNSYNFFQPFYKEVFRNPRFAWLVAANILAAPIVTNVQYYIRDRMFFEISENPQIVQNFTSWSTSKVTVWDKMAVFVKKIKKKFIE